MSARCQKCDYHLEPSEIDGGFRGCLVCQRDAAETRAKAAEDAFAMVCMLAAGIDKDEAGNLLGPVPAQVVSEAVARFVVEIAAAECPEDPVDAKVEP